MASLDTEVEGGKCWHVFERIFSNNNYWPPSRMASLARPTPSLILYTGSDTSSVEVGGLASQTNQRAALLQFADAWLLTCYQKRPLASTCICV